jgi:type VI secretion system secreted protein Hcp
MAYALYLKVAGIPGESTDEAHKGWIEILSFNHTVAKTEGEAGAPVYRDFSLAKLSDRATPLLARACTEGWPIKEVHLEVCRPEAGRARIMEIRLTDVTIAAYNVGGSPQESQATPFENVSLKSGKVEWRYFPGAFRGEKEPEPVKASWASDEYREPEAVPRARNGR